MQEIWKDVEGYTGYQISNLGRVKSVKRGKPRILKYVQTGFGYCRVSLCQDAIVSTKSIHQLVAIAFLGHKTGSHTVVVDHINNDVSDNRAINLQIISQRENATKDQFRQNFSSKYIGVSRRKGTNIWIAQIHINGKGTKIGTFINEIDAHNAYQEKLKQINDVK